MESGLRRGAGVGVGGSGGGDKDILKRKKTSTQPAMSTRNIDGGIHEAETHDSAALRSSTVELLRPEGSSPQETATSRLAKPTTNAHPHAAALFTDGDMKTRNEDNGEDNEGENSEEEMEEEEDVKGTAGEENEDEDYYYYNSYNDYNDGYNYDYREDMYDYDSEGHEEYVAGESSAAFTLNDGEEEEAGEGLEWEDEDRVDRMGAAADGPGAHYRQSDVGTLAFDRAFLYAVRHNPTGLLLYLGRYLNPQAN